MPKINYQVVREGEDTILLIDYENILRIPSIEDDALTMSTIIDKLIEVKNVTKIIFSQKRDYEYDYNQTLLLVEIANLYNILVKQKQVFTFTSAITDVIFKKHIASRYADLQRLIFGTLKRDPVAAYVELKRMMRHEKLNLEAATTEQVAQAQNGFISLINYLITSLESTKLMQLAQPYLQGFKPGDRNIYRLLFTPTIKPDFMFTKLMSSYPTNGTELETYTVSEDTDITIFSFPSSVKYLYHMMPPEFKLSEEEYEILDTSRNIMAEHKPKKEEFVDPERMREIFYNIGYDLIEELVNHKGLKFSQKKIDKLTKILVRYTVGFGLIEVLLSDEKIQDVSINSPYGQTPMFIVHQDYGDCYTNVVPTVQESESWASKLRMISGRPLDEANQILDTEIHLPGATARVSAITSPLDPTGLAFSFRRHRDKPWTLPLFIKAKMISPLAAGLLSFLIDGTRTLLVCGTRSSGKTSLLGSLLVEIMRRYRIITIEDTLELPTIPLRKLGFNIQPLKVSSALGKETSEMTASDGIRSTLRLGDSALFVGEVRSSLRGDEEVVIIENGLTKRIAIKNLDGKDLNSFFVPTLDEEQKMKLKKLTGFVKHPKRSQLIKITTKTGRQVTVTPDHSVFTHINFKIAAIKTDQLKVGDPIIIPSKLPNEYNDFDYINLLEIFKEDYRLQGAEPYIRKAISKIGWRKASAICKVPDIYRYLLSTQKTRIPIKYFLELMNKAKIKYDLEDLSIKRGTSTSIPAKFLINENILRLVGYYLAEGNSDGKKIQITNSKPQIIEDVTNICEKELGIKISKRGTKGLGTSTQMFITCKPLVDLFKYWNCGKTSLHKRVPEFVYGLSKKKICALLRGMYSGDGSISVTKTAGNMIRYFSTSKKLVEDVNYLLMSLGIVCRFHYRNLESGKKCYTAEIKQRKYVEQFLDEIGFTHKKPQINIKSFSHSKDDSVLFDPKELEKHLKLPRKYRHLRRTKCCSKDYLKRIAEEVKCSDEIYNFTHSDFFIDKIKSIEIINLKKPEYVYDLSVKSTQRFIGGFGGILLHNTEAIALYEAMRIGASANVVAGTIHADSPYGVFDRVVYWCSKNKF